MKNSIFTKPKLCKSPKGWYVYFYYRGKQKRYKKGINYIKNIYNRQIEANALAEALHIKLKNGWNPLIPEIVPVKNSMTISEALEFALDKKKEILAPKSYSGYKGTVNFLKTSTLALDLVNLSIDELKRIHIRSIIDKAKQQRNWSNKARNKHLNHLKALLSELLEWDILEYNPAHKIKNLQVETTRANTPADATQHEKIKKCLSLEHPYFYNFIRTIFHSGMRPKEILEIQLHMIDLKQQQFILPASSTKTNKQRLVPINNHLKAILEDMQLHNYPDDFYLYGSYREKGKGNKGKYIDFIPGPTQLKRDTATKRWKKIIIDSLGINVSMYSNKHGGGDAKIRAGIELDALRDLYGHSSKRMTEVYAKEIKNIYKNQIINKSPKY